MRGRAALVLAVVLTQAAQAAQQTFSNSTSVIAVEVPVQVLVDGVPVRGLTAGQFVVYDRGKRVPIRGFDVIDLTRLEPAAPATTAMAAQVPEVPVSGRRHILLLFDLAYAQRGYLERARQAASKLVAHDLHPSDLVAVGLFSPAHGARLLIGFTSDRQQVQIVLDVVGRILSGDVDMIATGKRRRRGRRDPLALTVVDIRGTGTLMSQGNDTASPMTEGLTTLGANARPATGRGDSGRTGARGDALLEEALTSMSEQYQAGLANALRDGVADLLGSLADLAETFHGVRGQKYLYFLSEGFDRSLYEGRWSGISDGPSGFVGSTAFSLGAARTLVDMRRMVESFRRSGWIIDSIDIGGLRAAPSDREDSLFFLAAETGGRLQHNSNDLHELAAELVTATSYSYVLTFQADDLPADGSWRPLKVELEGGPPGAKVVARLGYYAPKPFAETDDQERQRTTADLVLSGKDGGAAQIRVLTVPQPGARTPVLIEAPGSSLFGRTLPSAVEAYAYALDAHGAITDFLYEKMPLDPGRQGEALLRTGLKLFGTLDLPAGSYRLRVLVRNADSGVYALSTTLCEVPPVGRAYLAPPLFPDLGAPWAYFRASEPTSKPSGTPFVNGDAHYMPMAAPAVFRGHRAAMALLVWGMGPQLDLREQLIASDGTALPGQRLRMAPPEPSADGGPLRLFGTWDASGLARGSYLLRISLSDPASGAQTSSEAWLQVR